MKLVSKIYMIIVLAILSGCITPFEPVGLEQLDNLLVVEGDIVAGEISQFKISRSQKLSDVTVVNYENLMFIWIESEDGERLLPMQSGYEPLLPSGEMSLNGHYFIDTRNISVDKKYKLCFHTNDTKRYESGYVSILPTPPIESVDYEIKDESSLEIYVSSQNRVSPDNRYYKWRYQEDWEVHADIFAEAMYDEALNNVFEINPDQNRFYCWNHKESSEILLFTTKDLSENIVHKKRLKIIPSSDRRISYLYAINVVQSSISKDAYFYWETLNKNNNETGGIFSPMPSELRGNISCIDNPEEPVIGYIDGYTLSSKRVFIYDSEIKLYHKYAVCEIVQGKMDQEEYYENYSKGLDVITYFPEMGEVNWAPRECVDCRLFGTKKRPSFWPNSNY